MTTTRSINCAIVACLLAVMPPRLSAIMAGSATGTATYDADSPSNRETSSFTGVGYVNSCTCTAIDTSSIYSDGTGTWIVTAAHVVSGKSSVTVQFTVNGVTYSYTTSYIYVNSNYDSSTGDYDVALIYIPSGISSLITTYSLYTGTASSLVGKAVTLVGYGYSGYGTSGCSSAYARGVCRWGENTIDSIGIFETGSSCYVYVMDFDYPSTYGQFGGSLGNTVETTLCTGDSGGPLFYYDSATGKYVLAGVNVGVNYSGSTMGAFGTSAYSIAISGVYSWIVSTVETYSIVPEPSDYALMLGLGALIPLALRRRQRVAR